MTVKGWEIQPLTLSLILDNTGLMPLVARQRAEPLGDNIRVCQTVKFIRVTMPQKARPNRWLSPHFVCRCCIRDDGQILDYKHKKRRSLTSIDVPMVRRPDSNLTLRNLL